VKSKILNLLIAGLLVTSCVSTTSNSIHQRIGISASQTYSAFTLVRMNITSVAAGCTNLQNSQSCSSDIQEALIEMGPRSMGSSGSGIVVAHRNNRTYILTANHVCTENSPAIAYVNVLGSIVQVTLTRTEALTSVDINGVTREAQRDLSDPDNDVCIISTEGTWGPAVPVAAEQPPIGSVVYNIAAPRGIFDIGMVPIFMGMYSGPMSDGNEIYTIPARPGSSGSAVLNEAGQIVGVLHSVMVNFPHISAAASASDARNIINQIDNL